MECIPLRHSLRRLIAATTAGLGYVTGPCVAYGATWADIRQLTDLIKETGTEVITANCKAEMKLDNVKGIYVFEKDNKIDHLVYCKENLDLANSDEVWEVLSHEGTHIMQACHGGPVVLDEYIPRTMRNLQTFAPHYYKLVTEGYSSEAQRLELEAYDMELQEPSTVIELFKRYCFK